MQIEYSRTFFTNCLYRIKILYSSWQWRVSKVKYALTTPVYSYKSYKEYKEEFTWIEAAKAAKVRAAKQPKYYPYNSCKP
jgi:hypothetical protein